MIQMETKDKEKKVKTKKEKVKKEKVKKEKTKMSEGTKKAIIFFCIIVVVFICVGILVYFILPHDTKGKVKEKKELSSIKDYGYVLTDKDTALFKEEYEAMKKNLNSKEVNNEEYAKSVAKLFVIDLYTITNKVNKYDVGGTEFFHPTYVDNYMTKVKDSLYKYVQDDSEGKRVQNLPEVTSVNVKSCNEHKYVIKGQKDNKNTKDVDESTPDIELEGYKIELTWEYEKDFGYDKKGVLYVAKVDDKMYVVEKE